MKHYTGHRTVSWDIVYKRIDGPMSNLAVMANIFLPKRRVTGLSPKINLSKVESQSTYQSPFSKTQNQETCIRTAKKEPCIRWPTRVRLVYVFKHMFSVFKQYYMYFHILFHPHVFTKNTSNVIRTTLPNTPLISKSLE